MKKVSVIVLTWNGKEDTLGCVKSLEKLSIVNFQLSIIVVDNASNDGTQDAVKKLFKKIQKPSQIVCKLIENEKNYGFAEGNNIGMKYALENGADYLMVLNNDTFVDQNLAVDLIGEINKYSKAGAISPKIYFAKGFEYHKKRYKKSELGKVIWYAGGDMDWNNIYGSNHGVDEVDKGQFDKVTETDFATGCCMFFKREVLDKVGLFDNKYYAYIEDADLSQRVKKAGWKVLYTPHARLWHKVGQALGIGSERNDYYISRNRLIFGFRYARLRTKFALIRESIRLLLNGRKWQKIGIRDYYLARLGEGSWPTVQRASGPKGNEKK